MSRGFVKEDDQEESPIIPPRAALPDGLTNYVTSEGLAMLHKERDDLESSKLQLTKDDEQQRRRDLALIDGKLALLNDRLSSARVLDASEQTQDEVRFGATVSFTMNQQKNSFKIVGVDEADVKLQKIAFVAPIARAITGAKVGDEVQFQLGSDTRQIKILEISYH